MSEFRKEKATLLEWITVAGAVLGAFMAILDISIVNSALPNIQGSMSATLEQGSWISTSYLIMEIVVIPLTGLFTEVLSMRRLLILNATLFVVFSVLCGFSTSLTQMILFRGLQGFTGGVLIPTAATLIVTILPRSQRAFGMALFGVVATFGPSIGPTLGGWLTVHYSWRYAFYINVIPGLVLVAVNYFTLPRLPVRLEALRRADWIGVFLLAVSLSTLTTVLEEGQRKDWFSSPMISWLSAVATVTAILFFAKTLSSSNPIVNLRLFLKRNFFFASFLSVGMGVALYGSIYILPLFLSEVRNYNALQIGEVLMWVGFPQLLLLPLVPFLIRKIDVRWIIGFGVIVMAISFWMNSHLTHQWGYYEFRASQLVRALGQPFIMIPLTIVAFEGIAHEDVASASGLYNMLRNLGGSVGISLLSTLLADRYRFHFNRVTETVKAIRPPVQLALHGFKAGFRLHPGAHPETSQRNVLLLGAVINREARVMAYSDCFFAMALVLAITCVGLLFMHRVQVHGDEDMAAH